MKNQAIIDTLTAEICAIDEKSANFEDQLKSYSSSIDRHLVLKCLRENEQKKLKILLEIERLKNEKIINLQFDIETTFIESLKLLCGKRVVLRARILVKYDKVAVENTNLIIGSAEKEHSVSINQ